MSKTTKQDAAVVLAAAAQILYSRKRLSRAGRDAIAATLKETAAGLVPRRIAASLAISARREVDKVEGLGLKSW